MTATDDRTTNQAIIVTLSRLEDPFDAIFPLQQVMADLDRGIQQAEGCIYSKFSPGSPAYRGVEEEHHLEVIAYNRGAALILCQVLLTQVVADVVSLQRVTSDPRVSTGKTEILSLVKLRTFDDLSEVAAIDALANYFKHYREWSPDWEAEAFTTSDTARFTKRDVKKLGFSSQNKGDVGPGFDRLGVETCEELLEIVVGWRKRLHRYLAGLMLSSRSVEEAE